MNKSARFAFTWFLVFFLLNTFVGPWIGINNVEVNAVYILGNLVIWGLAGLVIYYFRKKQSKRDTDEKVG